MSVGDRNLYLFGYEWWHRVLKNNRIEITHISTVKATFITYKMSGKGLLKRSSSTSSVSSSLKTMESVEDLGLKKGDLLLLHNKKQLFTTETITGVVVGNLCDSNGVVVRYRLSDTIYDVCKLQIGYRIPGFEDTEIFIVRAVVFASKNMLIDLGPIDRSYEKERELTYVRLEDHLNYFQQCKCSNDDACRRVLIENMARRAKAEFAAKYETIDEKMMESNLEPHTMDVEELSSKKVELFDALVDAGVLYRKNDKHDTISNLVNNAKKPKFLEIDN